MSIAGIASTLFSHVGNLQLNQQAGLQTQFQQLAQDLQAGNLSQAQADFSLLQQSAPQLQSSGSPGPLQQAFSSLGKDLQSGNLAAAQQDLTTIEQDFQQAAQRSGHASHHHFHHSSGAQNSTSPPNSITQLFSTLGQDLQSGNLSGAQQAYSALQQDLPWLGTNANHSAGAPVNFIA